MFGRSNLKSKRFVKNQDSSLDNSDIVGARRVERYPAKKYNPMDYSDVTKNHDFQKKKIMR